jgi:hypothetical protein
MRRTLVALVAGLALGGALTYGLTPSPQASASSVATFNDGFADAKQDDCEQGSEVACEWVMQVNGIPMPPK